MFYRMNRTLSALILRLNLGTRLRTQDLGGMNGNGGETLRIRQPLPPVGVGHPRPGFVTFVKSRLCDLTASWIPGSPSEASRRAICRDARPRTAVAVAPKPAERPVGGVGERPPGSSRLPGAVPAPARALTQRVARARAAAAIARAALGFDTACWRPAGALSRG